MGVLRQYSSSITVAHSGNQPMTWWRGSVLVIATGAKFGPWRLLDWLRRPFIKLLYNIFSMSMLRDQSWQGPLIDSLAPAANNRILDFGPDSGATVITFARRYPEASFIAAEPSRKAAQRARQRVARQQINNVTVIDASLCARLPFDAGSFDKAVCVLAFHDRLPNEKFGIAKEMIRVLRRGGTLYIADYDKPQISSERGVLEFTRYISGRAAAEPHITGEWTEFLAKAGFSGIRRQSSHSIGIGRVSIVKAHKR